MTGQIYAKHLITSQNNYTCGYLGDKVVLKKLVCVDIT
jgi:hypothetical protein